MHAAASSCHVPQTCEYRCSVQVRTSCNRHSLDPVALLVFKPNACRRRHVAVLHAGVPGRRLGVRGVAGVCRRPAAVRERRAAAGAPGAAALGRRPRLPGLLGAHLAAVPAGAPLVRTHVYICKMILACDFASEGPVSRPGGCVAIACRGLLEPELQLQTLPSSLAHAWLLIPLGDALCLHDPKTHDNASLYQHTLCTCKRRPTLLSFATCLNAVLAASPL